MFLYVCSVLMDSIVLLISLIVSGINSVLSWITSAVGFGMLAETNELSPEDYIPLKISPMIFSTVPSNNCPPLYILRNLDAYTETGSV
ncbi:uncharacterized protein SOCG_01598 [Schizosaccharomyces octosporus yFS286]|uniref:Uncharacterized protein n=1 Tax=Schizosaccharomyces octosporus (strain yFS286) TaxID=483514 RepID=S9QYK9_SCHOY|nr:uncharacterized protein SOCG_01598 [Schizosaccharomyces octosporus yFS286]EPX71380.1 hypothetical protein SOCG_01598 [Schizosaccharomyces octosporus yFS286]